jgi:hypothetical protein
MVALATVAAAVALIAMFAGAVKVAPEAGEVRLTAGGVSTLTVIALLALPEGPLQLKV